MLKSSIHQFKRKAEILIREGDHLIAKSPLIVIAKNGITATQVDVTSAFHGQIARDATGNVDLVAEMSKHPDALWVRVKAIEADIPNDNGDYFSREEIIKAYKSFEGCPVFTNHENGKVENAKGKVVKADWDDRENAVFCTMFIDRTASPSLCRAVEEGYVTDVSMGTQVDYSTCSVCEKKAATANDYCDHVKTMKGRNVEGKKVFEKNYGLKFIEISVVTDGACERCTIQEVIDPNDYVTRIASAVNLVNRAIKTSQMTKDGGQAEIGKLNQAMDLLEDVSRTMLDQRQFIDLEFAQKVVEVLADLQHVNDELVDQGYGRIGDQGGQPQSQQMGIPPLPENSAGAKQEQPMQGPNPFLTGPSTQGVGTVTEPATASSGGRTLLSSQTRIKDLHEKALKIYEEAKLSRSGGDTSAMDKEKANQTIAKLAKVWENPSVKNYKMEVSEGDYKVVIGTDEIIGLKGGQKVAALKIANLDPDVKEMLVKEPGNYARDLVDALKTTVAAGSIKIEKTAEYTAGVSEKEQHEETMEAQLANQRPDLHPRENEIRESITEDQLRDKRNGYDYHERQDKSRDAITEKQLREGEYHGYEYHKVQDDPRDEIMELQLRNTKWKGNVTPAGKEGEWVAGVSDQHQQITEGQLNDWKGSDKRHLPTDRITEKQLAEDSENWGRRIASRDDAFKAKTAGFKALANTSIALGATPDELLAVIADFSASTRNSIAAERAVTSLKKYKENRQAMLGRAKFHGAPKTASQFEIADYLLGSLADEGMVGSVARETLEAIAENKSAPTQIADVIASAKTEGSKAIKTATSKDFLREALAETAREEINVLLDRAAIKADEKDAEKFAAAAYEAAIKVAEKSGLTITDKVHVAKKGDKIEVAMFGTKEAKKGDFGGKKAPPFGSKSKDGDKEDKEDKEDGEEKEASAEDLKARKEARKDAVKEVTAQFGGAAPGGDMGGGGGMPGPGGGTTMPPPPGGAGADPTAGVPPVAGLAEGAAGDEEAGTGEALPPGSICPVCGSDNVDIRHGEFACNDCGAAGEFHVSIDIKEWPNVVEDTEPNDEEGMGGADEGGIGDMGGGAGMEMGAGAPPPGGMEGGGMPGVGMQQAFKITPEMVKTAGGKPVGSYCPHCGSNKVKLALQKGCGDCSCGNCKGKYKVETKVDVENKTLKAEVSWNDMRVPVLAAQKLKSIKAARVAEKAMLAKKAALESALKRTGMVAKFAKANPSGKAEIIAKLADNGLLLD